MKLADFAEATRELEEDDIVTVRFRFNRQGRLHPGSEATGQFAWITDDGWRIKLWNRDRPIYYRFIISITKG